MNTTQHTNKRRIYVMGALAALVAVLTLLSSYVMSSQGALASVLRTPTGGSSTAQDGVLPKHASVFDDSLPGVSKLSPPLRAALQDAAKAAQANGIRLTVTSGWRSARYQQQLSQQSLKKYGSKEAAAKWVASPATSAHVKGEAVDLGPMAGTDWLSRHGSAYGLCQIYANESWHYELRPAVVTDGCPQMYASASEDPRLQG